MTTDMSSVLAPALETKAHEARHFHGPGGAQDAQGPWRNGVDDKYTVDILNSMCVFTNDYICILYIHTYIYICICVYIYT